MARGGSMAAIPSAWNLATVVYLANKSEADSDVKSTDEFAYQYGRRQNKRQ